MNKIPEFILCPTPELARQVLEKIERESDLRWWFNKKPSDIDLDEDEDYPIVIDSTETHLSACKKDYYSKQGITNFTKAEDFLNNNYMTNKTWDNLEVGDTLISKNGDEEKVLGQLGNLFALSWYETQDMVRTWLTREALIRLEYKIKGASEDKPSIDSTISAIQLIHPKDGVSVELKKQAIEMLKKLK